MSPPTGRRRLPIETLLAVPVLALVWPPLYNRAEPALLGMPFFYAYQLALVPVTAACLLVVHRVRQRARRPGRRPPG